MLNFLDSASLLVSDCMLIYAYLLQSQIGCTQMVKDTPQEEKMCRICRQTQQQYDNPLVNPSCSCRGSVAWIHEDCLLNEIIYKIGFINHYQCSCCKSLIKFYTIRQKKQWYIILRDICALLMLLATLLYMLSWLNQNERKLSRRLWGYPQFKIIPYVAIGISVAAFVNVLYVIHWGLLGIYTGRRRIRFYQKQQKQS